MKWRQAAGTSTGRLAVLDPVNRVERRCAVGSGADGELAFAASSADHAALIFARSVGLSHIWSAQDLAEYLYETGDHGYIVVDDVCVLEVVGWSDLCRTANT